MTFKKRWLVLVLASVLVSGCATTQQEQAYYEAAVQMQIAQKPLVKITAQPGQNIVLSGVAEFAVYGAAGTHLVQYVDPSIGLARDVIVGVTGLGSVFLGLYGAEQIVRATGDIAGRNVNYGSGNNIQTVTTGNINSPGGAAANANRDATAAPAITTTTTTETNVNE